MLYIVSTLHVFLTYNIDKISISDVSEGEYDSVLNSTYANDEFVRFTAKDRTSPTTTYSPTDGHRYLQTDMVSITNDVTVISLSC